MKLARYHGVKLGIYEDNEAFALYEDNEAFADWVGVRNAYNHRLIRRRGLSGFRGYGQGEEVIGGLMAAESNGTSTNKAILIGLLTIVVGHIAVKLIDKAWK